MFVRKVKTGSGAVAVQIARKQAGRDIVMKHLGSAHTDSELTLLVELAKEEIFKGQLPLFPKKEQELKIVALASVSEFLYKTLLNVYRRLGFLCLTDEVFSQLVVARLIEPTSKLDTVRVLRELGLNAPSKDQIHRCLKKVVESDYRGQVSTACFNYCRSLPTGDGLSLLLYDVTTLYFESQEGDEFRKPGLSKERRLEPQIVVGLLVNRDGFPLEISEFEGNKAETKTIVPTLASFYKKHSLDKSKITVTADAGMLSTSNLRELEDAGFLFIVGSRIAKTPYQIKEHHKSHPDEDFEDGQIFETTQSFGREKLNRRDWRVIYQYKKKRAKLDLRNLDKQVTKAQNVLTGKTALRKNKFVSIKGVSKSLNEKLILEHTLQAGIKGYVTNLPSSTKKFSGTSSQEIINAYHQLFQVEKSFRMSKSDLKARPIFHHKLDSIKAHLTIVFTALAIARYIESHTQISLKKFIQTLRVIRTPTVRINGTIHQIQPFINNDVENLVDKLNLKT
jgi:transposase